MIEARHLSASFEGVSVLDDVNIRVRTGNIVGIVGVGGVGKSVLLKLLCGLMTPDEGHVMIDDVDIASLDVDGLGSLRRRFGMLFQNFALFDFLTVGENVAFPLEQSGDYTPSEIQDRVRERLVDVGLAGSEMLYPRELSGGMKKRVSMARATIANAPILLYDDPSAGLDPVTSSKIFSLIERLHDPNGVSVVVSHDIDRMIGVCHEWVLLHQGRVWFVGGIEAVKTSSDPVVATFFDTASQGEVV
jgi:phospholipid/cholesterol/gamma-HCH transport system ATP-binding protein